MNIDQFDYCLPDNLIAHRPAEPRHSSRLMIIDRASKKVEHRRFWDVKEYLKEDDLLVFNDTRVINARMHGFFAGSFESKLEVLLIEQISTLEWKIICKPAKKLKLGVEIQLIGQNNLIKGVIKRIYEDELRGIEFDKELNLELDGLLPLPPYIKIPLDDNEKYQTVYSRTLGSIAAPTAGLHFTDELLAEIVSKRIEMVYLTLHIGLGTFKPVRAKELDKHKMHYEKYEIDNSTLKTINSAKAEGRRIVCVGTTTVRVLEHLAESGDLELNGDLRIKGSLSGQTNLFIYPGYKFQVVDAMITNFHLPRSTLLMLVSAFTEQVYGENEGVRFINECYRIAVEMNYRFYSFGDAMLIN